MDLEFQSIDDLKRRVMPALRIRRRELKKKGIIITEDEIWTYFAKSSWKNAYHLTLARVVDDILNRNITTDEIL